MRRVLSKIDSISKWSGKVVSISMLVIIGILIFEVTLRYLFNAPTIWAHELSLMIWGGYSVIAGAYTLVHRQHVKVDLVYNWFPPRGRAIIDSCTYLLFFFFVGLILFYGTKMALWSVRIGEYSFTAFAPLIWPVKLTIPIGAFLILIQGIAEFTRSLGMAIYGRELE